MNALQHDKFVKKNYSFDLMANRHLCLNNGIQTNIPE